MDPKDTTENQDESKKRTLPTYVFGDDYEQTVNLANNQEAEEPEKKVEDTEPVIEDEVHDEAANMSVNAELQKMGSAQPVSMIVTKKKFRLKFLLLIFFIVAIAFGVTYGMAILSEQGVIGSKSSRHTAAGFSTKKLVCEMDSDAGQLLGAGNAIESRSHVEINYNNDEFVDLLQILDARFENSSTAKIAMNNVRSNYVKNFKNFGIATEPFKSEYNQNDTAISVTHYADADMIDSTNAGVINISVNENKVVIYDINSIKKNYEDAGYACHVE